MPAAKRVDPFRNFNFLVEIDGLAVAGFSECSGLGAETDVIEYREGSDKQAVRKLPGLQRYPSIVLKRGISGDKSLWQWWKSVRDGQADRRNGSIVLLDAERTEVARWNFINGWPSKWEGPAFSAKANGVAIETLEIVHEGLEWV
jgi:phage tail-like protein